MLWIIAEDRRRKEEIVKGAFKLFVVSITNPARGGPMKADTPRMKVKAPKLLLRCLIPSRSTRRLEVTEGNAASKRPNIADMASKPE